MESIFWIFISCNLQNEVKETKEKGKVLGLVLSD
jgi:hypothetical protein